MKKISGAPASARFIFITIFIEALGIGLLIPVFPDIIRRYSSDPSYINQHFGYFISIYAFMQFLASPVLGSLSDRFGRRPVLLFSLIGAAIDYVLMAFAPNIGLLYLGRIISGVTGAGMTVASSYMADVSDDSNRSANFGLIGAAFGLGFIAGPLIGGLLANLNHQIPFFVAAAFNGLNFLFGYFILPESLSIENRRKIQLKNMNPFRSLKKILEPSPILLLVLVYFFLFLSGHVHPSVWTLYTQSKFNWSTFDVGLSLSCVGLCMAFSQGYLTRIIIPRWGEKWSLYFGSFVQMFCFLLFGLANQGWMMFAILPFSAMSGLAMPSLQSLMTKQVPANEQGELQGTLVGLASLTAIIGPLLYTNLFDKFAKIQGTIDLRGAPYYGASLITILALVLIWLHFQRKNQPTL